MTTVYMEPRDRLPPTSNETAIRDSLRSNSIVRHHASCRKALTSSPLVS